MPCRCVDDGSGALGWRGRTAHGRFHKHGWCLVMGETARTASMWRGQLWKGIPGAIPLSAACVEKSLEWNLKSRYILMPCFQNYTMFIVHIKKYCPWVRNLVWSFWGSEFSWTIQLKAMAKSKVHKVQTKKDGKAVRKGRPRAVPKPQQPSLLSCPFQPCRSLHPRWASMFLGHFRFQQSVLSFRKRFSKIAILKTFNIWTLWSENACQSTQLWSEFSPADGIDNMRSSYLYWSCW